MPRSSRAFLLAALLCLPVGPALAAAESPAVSSSGMTARYPSGSIGSVTVADQALADVQHARSAIEARFVSEQRACHDQFFANNCVAAAADRRRIELGQVRMVEVEANAYKRRTQAAERDRILADKRARSEADLAARLAEQAAHTVTGKPAPLPSDPQTTAATDGAERGVADGASPREVKVRRLRENEALDQRKRAENVESYEKKVMEAHARQRRVEERKQEKERSRQEKAAMSPMPR